MSTFDNTILHFTLAYTMVEDSPDTVCSGIWEIWEKCELNKPQAKIECYMVSVGATSSKYSFRVSCESLGLSVCC